MSNPLMRNVRPPSPKLPVRDDERAGQCDLCFGGGEIECACMRCLGEGQVEYVASDHGNTAMEECEDCKGLGYTVQTCPDCQGTGQVPEDSED